MQIRNVTAGEHTREEEQRTVRGQSDVRQSNDVPELVMLEQTPSSREGKPVGVAQQLKEEHVGERVWRRKW